MAQYNGWTNYETWNVKLWIDNDEGSQNYWLEAAREADGNARDLADRLKDEHVESMPAVTGVYADLLKSALDEVDWREIAEALISDDKEINPDEYEQDDEENDEADADA